MYDKTLQELLDEGFDVRLSKYNVEDEKTAEGTLNEFNLEFKDEFVLESGNKCLTHSDYRNLTVSVILKQMNRSVRNG